MSYATLTQLKEYLAVSSASDDALLTDLLTRATATIDQLTRTTFAAGAATAREYGRDAMWWDGKLRQDWLLLPSATYIAQLVGVLDADAAVIPLAEITVYPPEPPYTVLIRKGARWCGETQTITVTARWGYSITPPVPIVHATIRLAAWMYRQRGAANDPDRPVVADQGMVLLPSQLPADVRELLASYLPVV